MQVLIDWILEQGTTSDDLGALLTGIGERLLESGVPAQRASLDLPTIDPGSRAISYKWWRDRPAAVQTLPHGTDQEGVFQRSVVYHLLSTGLDIGRWRLDRREGSQFELLRELRAQGLTDYVLRLAGFGDSTSAVKGVAFSIATDRPGGFSDSALRQASRITPALRLAAYRISAAHTASNALSVYLGSNTARSVLAGEIQRGGGERIAAAVLFADLKRFTVLSEHEDTLDVMRWLNEHFQAIGDAVMAKGGEILKFLGDGLLAVFAVENIDRWPCPGCEDALRAAEAAVAANHALNKRRAINGDPVLQVDVALNFGEVVYGNVGASRRLDFTVIGPVVNETCRIEGLCDELGHSIILSETFARRCSRKTTKVGAFALRGIEGPRSVCVPLQVPAAARALLSVGSD